MKAICVVAHPDDCIIFAYAFIYNHPEYQWSIAFVTNSEFSERGKEITKFWNSRGINTMFLGYEDNVDDHWTNHAISFDTVEANNKIQALVKDYDLILTHNKNGEYGHIHHVFVNSCLNEFDNVVTFNHLRNFYKFKFLNYNLPQTSYSLSEVPVHATVIKEFHKPNIFGNLYFEYNSPKDLTLLVKLVKSKFLKKGT
jgi:hypothetical protein